MGVPQICGALYAVSSNASPRAEHASQTFALARYNMNSCRDCTPAKGNARTLDRAEPPQSARVQVQRSARGSKSRGEPESPEVLIQNVRTLSERCPGTARKCKQQLQMRRVRPLRVVTTAGTPRPSRPETKPSDWGRAEAGRPRLHELRRYGP